MAPASNTPLLDAAIGMPVAAAAPGMPLMWIALGIALVTLLAWLLRQPPAHARWPRIGFGVALLVACLAITLQLATDVGTGSSTLRLRLHRGTAGTVTPSSLRTAVACYLAAMAASGWGAWRLLRPGTAARR